MWSLALSDMRGLLAAVAEHSNLGMAIIHLGPWATVSSLCFFVGALVGGDLLALRGALMLAYVFSLVNGLTGVPSFPYFNVEGRVNVDMVCWAVMSGCLHGCAVFRMLLDELPVRFSTQDEEQLARFLNRRSGMERLEARETLKRGQWMKVAAGERIVSSVELHEQVFLLIEGKCCFNSACCFPSWFTAGAPLHHNHNHHHLHSSHRHSPPSSPPAAGNSTAGAPAEVSSPPAAAWTDGPRQPRPINTHVHVHNGNSSTGRHAPGCTGLVEPPAGSPPLLRSGHIFSLSALNVFGVYIGFDQDHGRHLEVWAETDCLLYCWPMSALEEMATNYSPALASYWRNFIMYSIASEFEHRAHKGIARCSTGELECTEWLQGARSRDFTDELRPYELPAGVTWDSMKRWIKKAVSPFPPHGIRHTALPTSGVMARTRAMAVSDARKQAEAAAQAKEAELQEIAACSICSDMVHHLTPRTAASIRHQRELAAAAMRHEQERAWLDAWKGTAAVEDSSIWLRLPTGCAANPYHATPQQQSIRWQEVLQQQQQGGGKLFERDASADDVTIWMAAAPGSVTCTPSSWQQQQQVPAGDSMTGTSSCKVRCSLPAAATSSGPVLSPSAGSSQQQRQQHHQQRRVHQPSCPTSLSAHQQPYSWGQQQQQLQQAAAKAWFVRAHPIPDDNEIGSDNDDANGSGSLTAPLLVMK